MKRQLEIEKHEYKQWKKNIWNQKIGIAWDSAIKFILVMVCKASYVLFVSRENDIVLIVFRKKKNRERRIRNAIIVGLRWATISNPIYIFIRCREISTGRWVNAYILTRFFNQLWSLGSKCITILFWRKMVTWGIDWGNPILYGRGMSQIA